MPQLENFIKQGTVFQNRLKDLRKTLEKNQINSVDIIQKQSYVKQLMKQCQVALNKKKAEAFAPGQNDPQEGAGIQMPHNNNMLKLMPKPKRHQNLKLTL